MVRLGFPFRYLNVPLIQPIPDGQHVERIIAGLNPFMSIGASIISNRLQAGALERNADLAERFVRFLIDDFAANNRPCICGGRGKAREDHCEDIKWGKESAPGAELSRPHLAVRPHPPTDANLSQPGATREFRYTLGGVGGRAAPAIRVATNSARERDLNRNGCGDKLEAN